MSAMACQEDSECVSEYSIPSDTEDYENDDYVKSRTKTLKKFREKHQIFDSVPKSRTVEKDKVTLQEEHIKKTIRCSGNLEYWLKRFEKQKDNGVIQITNDNYMKIIQNEDLLLVWFYAPNDFYSRFQLSDFGKANKDLINLGYKGRLAMCDMDENKTVRKKLRPYFSYQLFHKGKFVLDLDQWQLDYQQMMNVMKHYQRIFLDRKQENKRKIKKKKSITK